MASTHPNGPVYVMENHDHALTVWRGAGVRRRILVHVDAHHDSWWIEEHGIATIANYICQALKEDIAGEIYWVVPTASWQGRSGRRAILRHLRKITRKYPGSGRPRQTADQVISAEILGKPFRVCSLRSLPPIHEEVLLDVDTDFLVIPNVRYGSGDEHRALPWCWPADLVAELRAKAIRGAVTTIAYSVEGGYTPLRWKYLGDELALRLSAVDEDNPEIQGARLLQEASLALEAGDAAGAEEAYQQAAELLPRSAAALYHRALLCYRDGRLDEARQLHRLALDRDPSYRTAYSDAGLKLHGEGRFREAEREFQRTIALNPESAYPYYGIAKLRADKKRWDEAEVLLKKALALDGNLVDAHRLLGDVLAGLKRTDEAIRAYERSLRLALSGHRTLHDVIATCESGDTAPLDPGHCAIHARLAALYASKGATREAINGYRISIAGKYDRSSLRFSLAVLYLKTGGWGKALAELWPAIKLMPSATRSAWRRSIRRARMLLWRPQRLVLSENDGALSSRRRASPT